MTKIKKTILVGTIGVFLCTAGINAFLLVRYWDSTRFGEDIEIANINLSGKTYKEGIEILQKKEKTYLNGKIKFKLGNSFTEIPLKDLGIEIDLNKTINTIKNSKNPIFGEEIPIIKNIDETKITAMLVEKFKLENQLPKSANFYFEKDKLLISEEKNGVTMDEHKLLADIEKTANALETGEIDILLKNTPAKITKAKLEKEKDTISEEINRTIVLVDPIYSDDWVVKIKDHLNWVKFVQKPKPTFEQFISGKITEKIYIEINQAELNKFVDKEISKWLDKPASDVKIYKGADGKFKIEGEGSDGLMIQRRLLKESIELAIENNIKNITIPVVAIKPKIIPDNAAKTLGITERLSVGHTSYYGSPANRVHNIKNGKEKFNEVLIAHGETFSFNKALGEVDGKTGYKMELVIKPEGTIPEYGGGICQVSTTMYRAAIFAGLPIEERHQHSYAVSYYSQILGHGLDATIYLGGADLKFKNDTGNSILIQAYVKDDYELYIVFYGKSDGRIVEMDGPYISNQHGAGPTVYEETSTLKKGIQKQTERAHGGFDALWYRYITSKNGEKTKEEIKSIYKAMPAKILTGTGG